MEFEMVKKVEIPWQKEAKVNAEIYYKMDNMDFGDAIKVHYETRAKANNARTNLTSYYRLHEKPYKFKCYLRGDCLFLSKEKK